MEQLLEPSTVPTATHMQVRKRNGTLEAVDVNKIVRAVARCCENLPSIDAMKVATKTIGGLYDGATTKELDTLSIQTAAGLIAEEPEYSQLAARLLALYIQKEVTNQEIHSFSQSIAAGARLGLINESVATFVVTHARKLNHTVDHTKDELFEYFGLRTVYDRYLLRHPTTREVIESPQYFFLRVACGLAQTHRGKNRRTFYTLLSRHEYMTSTPARSSIPGRSLPRCRRVFCSTRRRMTLSRSIASYMDIALLSKFSGGIGVALPSHSFARIAYSRYEWTL